MRIDELREKIRSRAKAEFLAGRFTLEQLDLCDSVANHDTNLQEINEHTKDMDDFWDWFIMEWQGVAPNHYGNNARCTIGDCR